MNRKQKVLTVIGLIFFVLIGVLSLISGEWVGVAPGVPGTGHFERMNPFVPWFFIGVIYAGLFFLLADKKEKR